ncbi:MAG: aminopeptidase [Saprospiraceae bacterium]|nr:aminopeptidase [Saprospiraceae bacterium]
MTDHNYASLLLDYCLEIKEKDRLYIKSTTLAEPLLRELFRQGTQRGANIVIDMGFSGQNKIFMDHANENQLNFVSPNFHEAMHHYDAYLVIRAPFNLREDQNIDPAKRKARSLALKELNQAYFTRTANGELARTLCQYPTQASAQEAGMSLEEYRQFVFKACNLDKPDPKKAWLEVREKQQSIVDHLNTVDKVRYVGKGTDISFSVKGRTWMNSDGRTNMPSGEVFTGPIEDSVNGHVYFAYPSIYMGTEVQGIHLEVKDGNVIKWSAEKGGEILNQVFDTEGARRFGEVAIGTNYSIQKPTKNILFDEKIGGTIHMAVGQSYKQTGGTNQSPIHWDMIAEMKDGGQIYTDGTLIYENGFFL